MLDLTAAFDTFDHSLLLSRLQGRFGVEGICLAWFVSYLSDRTYCVVVDGLSSRIIHMHHTLSSTRLGSGPTALYFCIRRSWRTSLKSHFTRLLTTINSCHNRRWRQRIEPLAQWMAANRIKFNAAKTELMWSGTKNNLLKIPGGSGGLHSSAHTYR